MPRFRRIAPVAAALAFVLCGSLLIGSAALDEPQEPPEPSPVATPQTLPAIQAKPEDRPPETELLVSDEAVPCRLETARDGIWSLYVPDNPDWQTWSSHHCGSESGKCWTPSSGIMLIAETWAGMSFQETVESMRAMGFVWEEPKQGTWAAQAFPDKDGNGGKVLSVAATERGEDVVLLSVLCSEAKEESWGPMLDAVRDSFRVAPVEKEG